MKVTRTSRLSGITRTMDLDITQEQLLEFANGSLIQDAFPNLSAAEREFFMTGIVDSEWDEAFKDIPDDIKNGNHGC